NPTRSSVPTIDWRLYKERHQIECFFNKLKRYRRIALRCEKTLTAFMGFVHSRMRYDLVTLNADTP
ncbi:hypothetical protein P036_00001, partial [Brucella canis 04-2330-1]